MLKMFMKFTDHFYFVAGNSECASSSPIRQETVGAGQPGASQDAEPAAQRFTSLLVDRIHINIVC